MEHTREGRLPFSIRIYWTERKYFRLHVKLLHSYGSFHRHRLCLRVSDNDNALTAIDPVR